MTLTRRDFIGGLAAFYAAPQAFAKDDPAILPAYYADYLARIADKVRADAVKGTQNGFFFLTDPHISANYCRSGLIIADLVRRTGVKRVIGGGDYSVAFTYGKPARPFVERLYEKMKTLWRDPIEAAGGLLFTAKGNHDLRAWTDSKRTGGFVYASAKTRELLMATRESAAVTVNPDEKSGVYFYRDDAQAKVRYIVADTSDGVREAESESTGAGYANVIRPEQMKWLGEVALGTVPEGYGVVVAHHIPLTPFTLRPTKGEMPYSDFRRTLEAYQAHGKASTAAGTFDFSSRKGGDILFDITGHMHADRFTCANGILHITEVCDAYYSDPLGATPFSGRLFTSRKERKGTVKEQGFDLLMFGGGTLRATRIGIGQDRIFRLKPLVLKRGETHRLASELEGVRWRIFDSWDVKRDDKQKDPDLRYTFSNEIAAISSEGVVTAKAPGWATAIAIAPDFRKEVFGIHVA